MALNIKNDRVCALAAEAARKTGRTQVSVLEEALTKFLADLTTDEDHAAAVARRIAASEKVVQAARALLTDADRAAIKAEMADMYDEWGLPR